MDNTTRSIVETIAARLKQWREEHEKLFGERPDRGFCQPAVDFEKAQRLTGIAQQYRLPEGLSAHDLQSYAMLSRHGTEEQQLDKMTAVWGLLTACNPELKKIACDPQDAKTLYHMIMGVASAYNIDDIQLFISKSTSSHKAWEMEKTPEFMKLTEVFNRYAAPGGLNLRWVAAPQTLQLIHDKILKKYH